jgi:hypothetical protein
MVIEVLGMKFKVLSNKRADIPKAVIIVISDFVLEIPVLFVQGTHQTVNHNQLAKLVMRTHFNEKWCFGS